MKFILFILLNICIIVISINKKNIQTNFEIGKNQDIIIQTTIIKLKSGGNYTINGKYNDLTIVIKSSNVIVNLYNGMYNSLSSNIIVEERLSNIIINIKNSNLNSKKLITIKKFSKVKLNIISSKITNNLLFDVEKKYNIKIKGQIKYNKANNFQKISQNILSNRDIIFYCENNNNLLIKNLYMTFISEHKISKQFFQNINKKSSNIKICKVKLKEKIILTMTSWKRRISKCHKSIERLLKNTIKPYKLILNLSKEEFPKKEKQLPKTLLNLKKKYKNFKINWVYKNNNVFKKLIPTLYKYKMT